MRRTKGSRRRARQNHNRKKARLQKLTQNEDWAKANAHARRTQQQQQRDGQAPLTVLPEPNDRVELAADPPEKRDQIGWGPGQVKPRDVVRMLRIARGDDGHVFSEEEIVQLLRGALPLGADAVLNRQHRNYATIMRTIFEAAKMQEAKQPQVGVTANGSSTVQVQVYLPQKDELEE